jgi:hypothetical protein
VVFDKRTACLWTRYPRRLGIMQNRLVVNARFVARRA